MAHVVLHAAHGRVSASVSIAGVPFTSVYPAQKDIVPLK